MARNIMSRSFTRREKGLFLILALILIGCLYYFGVVKNVEDTKAANAQAVSAIYDDIAIQQAVSDKRIKMESELENLGSLTDLPEVAVYDNVSNELSELNEVLSAASDYDLKLETPTIDGNTIRRVVSVSYSVPNYAEALKIVDALQNGKYRCEVTDFEMTAKLLVDGSIEAVTGTLKVTYYETAVGASSLNGLEDVTQQ